MTSSFPMRARHVTERAKVLRAFPLRLNSIDLTLSASDDRVRERNGIALVLYWREEGRILREVSRFVNQNCFVK